MVQVKNWKVLYFGAVDSSSLLCMPLDFDDAQHLICYIDFMVSQNDSAPYESSSVNS